ncbi:hypothetical protein DPMN_131720 [Dreissena polymorpha]|uniref:Uncharacterized protein n=1 Tax=Dreissena polymorpha TaxID=45954 RepID=A0A9D4FTP2_DREPO|nr:hypothetical protein DPMN_131720 [Dreissena polymorpha]
MSLESTMSCLFQIEASHCHMERWDKWVKGILDDDLWRQLGIHNDGKTRSTCGRLSPFTMTIALILPFLLFRLYPAVGLYPSYTDSQIGELYYLVLGRLYVAGFGWTSRDHSVPYAESFGQTILLWRVFRYLEKRKTLVLYCRGADPTWMAGGLYESLLNIWTEIVARLHRINLQCFHKDMVVCMCLHVRLFEYIHGEHSLYRGLQ